MIVVGTHARRGVERFVLGSVAEALVRSGRCPVLVAVPKDYSHIRLSDRPEPGRPGEDLHAQRPDGAHWYESTQTVSWTTRDVDAVGVDF
jgi:hypothetical protein